MITIAYITARMDCRFEWFAESLKNSLKGDWSDIRVVVVDFFAQAHLDWTQEKVELRRVEFRRVCDCPDFHHVPPAPTVWQGPHRLTKVDFFAVANMRNTALCLAPDGWIAYVDDLSVMIPEWIDEVRRAMSEGYIALGTYRKVCKLKVESGIIASFEDNPVGWDTRLKQPSIDPNNKEPIVAAGSWMYGCSVAMPVESLLNINGWDTDADSMSGEDYICGIMLDRSGSQFRLCPRMFTFESEELHFVEKPFLRIIKLYPGYRDSSHALLDWVMKGRYRAPNYQNYRETRKLVLAGEPFPIVKVPDRDWRDGQLLSDMGPEMLEKTRR